VNRLHHLRLRLVGLPATSTLSALGATVVLWASPLWAAGDAHGGGHGEPHVANWWGIGEKYAETPALGFLAITFLVFVGGLVAFARKPLADHLASRADAVEKAIAEATKAKEAALARAREAEARFAALEGEVKKMKADFEAQGKAEADRIETAAADMARKISRDTDDMIAAELERAREALRAEASKLALQLAEERIRQMLTSDDDARLKRGLVNELSA
jgi:F-type H+-transporting ATPase subunit b